MLRNKPNALKGNHQYSFKKKSDLPDLSFPFLCQSFPLIHHRNLVELPFIEKKKIQYQKISNSNVIAMVHRKAEED